LADADDIIRYLLDSEESRSMTWMREKPRAERRVYQDAWDAAAKVPRSGWREWREAGVQFSKFHRPGTAFALPFRTDDYLWAGPFTLKMPDSDLPTDPGFRLGAYRRGVQKYSRMLAKGLRLPPVALLYDEAWGWTMQDGNHRYEALARAGAATIDAFLGKPKMKKPINSF
jgi:hypothetical protein